MSLSEAQSRLNLSTLVREREKMASMPMEREVTQHEVTNSRVWISSLSWSSREHALAFLLGSTTEQDTE